MFRSLTNCLLILLPCQLHNIFFFFLKTGYYLNVVHVIITSHVEAPGNSKHPGAALSAIFVCLRWTRIDSYVCVLCECLYLCVCVINAIAEHVVVDSTVIARSAMLLWLCADLWPPGRALPTSLLSHYIHPEPLLYLLARPLLPPPFH